ncbi:MAG: DUF1003 domain-containing protein [Novosphingobium sp.]
MHELERTPEKLAEDLIGRRFEELEEEEQDALRRICSARMPGLDPKEFAALHASWGDRLADKVAAVGGSWSFILAFGVVLLAWVLINSRVLEAFGLRAFDAYPYIFLNLLLSMLAAIQAPVIMMSQNRQAAKDRIAARHDYEVNLRAQLEIIRVQQRLEELIEHLGVREGERERKRQGS